MFLSESAVAALTEILIKVQMLDLKKKKTHTHTFAIHRSLNLFGQNLISTQVAAAAETAIFPKLSDIFKLIQEHCDFHTLVIKA